MSHSGRGRTTPQGPQRHQGRDSGAHAQAQATTGHPATHASGGSGGASCRSRRPNHATGPFPRTNPAPYTIPRSRFDPVGPEPPNAPSAPGAPAGHRRTYGGAAWDAHSPAAATPQGASAACTTTSNCAPQPSLSTTTTTPRPVAGTGGPSEQLNDLQWAYPLYQADTQGYTTNPALASRSLGGVVPPSALPSQSGSLHLCICDDALWLAWCDLAWGHLKAAMTSPSRLLSRDCTCPQDLPDGAVTRECPLAAEHLLAWMNTYLVHFYQYLEALPSAPSTVMTTSGTTRTPLTSPPTHDTPPPTQDICQPSDIAQNLSSFVSHPGPSGGDPYSLPVDPPFTVNSSDTVAPSSPSRPSTLSNHRRKVSRNAVNPPTKRPRRAHQPKVTGNTGTKVDTKDEFLGFVGQPELQKFMRALLAAIRGSNFVKCNEHEPKLGDPDADDLMAIAIASYGSPEADSPAPDEIWGDYGTRGKSIYDIFIEGGYKCRLCGDEQPKDKPLRALRHFRTKHLGHKPFRCEDIHDGTKKCNARFACNETMVAHKKEMVNPKPKVTFICEICGNKYTYTISNKNKHVKACKKRRERTGGAGHSSASQSLPDSNGAVTRDGLYEDGREDDDGYEDDDSGHDNNEYGHDNNEY